jgi:hypothetical protein
LKNCWNFSLGKLTGCDTCENKPCRIATVNKDCGFATVFKGKFNIQKQNKDRFNYEEKYTETKLIDVAIKRIALEERKQESEIIKMMNEMTESEIHTPENIVRFYCSVKDNTHWY